MAEIRLIMKKVSTTPEGATEGVAFQTVLVEVPQDIHDALTRKDGYMYSTTSVVGAEAILKEDRK